MLEKISFAIVLLPLFASIIAGFGGKLIGKDGDIFAIRTTCAAVILAAVLSIYTYFQIAVFNVPTINATLYEWLNTGTLTINFGVMVDKLTATMMIVVTIISACVHVYSIGYMEDDDGKTRFFAYLSFFTFTMLALVSAPNLLQMFLGWEGVGLASYLLIGFWFKKQSACAASMKAFIVNRVADMGLLLAMFTTILFIGSLDYSQIFAAIPTLTEHNFSFLGHQFPVLNVIAALLFMGAMGKSAQFGFHTWLPDAMEGPTPVSALIHAATMVTAGVFLLCRMSPLFELAPTVLIFVGWIGAITAIFAATIGLTQRDIKRVIAYSTCSQLGYMFFAIGVSAYGAAMFHLTTHAFFKALLFLGAGSVIHAAHHQQDMFKLGGLRPYMKITYALMWVGSLALIGFPLLAGFFSKDLILESAFAAHQPYGIHLYAIGTLAALLTAFYSFRVIFKTFHGESAIKNKDLKHIHDAPDSMMIPMLVLAIGAIFGGFMFSDMAHLEWWHGAIHIAKAHLADVHHVPYEFKYLPTALALFGVFLAYVFYILAKGLPNLIAKLFKPLYALSLNKWYIDEIYEFLILMPVRNLALILKVGGDEEGIDRYGPNGIAFITQKTGGLMRLIHTGYVYHYALGIIIGICLIISWLILRGGAA